MTAPDPVAAQLNQQGLASLRAGDWAAAARSFEGAAARDPKSSALWRNLATACRAGGDGAGELRALDAALDADRRDILAWIRKAETHQRLDQRGDAFTAWSNALSLEQMAGGVPDALKQLLEQGRAFVAEGTGRMREAADAALAPMRGGLDETAARRTAAFVDHALGARPIYANQCAGLHYPFLPADEFFDHRHFPWFDAIEARAPAIRAELGALLADPGESLRPYVRMEKGLPDNLWSGLDNSLDWGACFLWEYGGPNRAVLDRCPETAAALAEAPLAPIPGRSPSAFFSILKPGKRIPPHTGVTNTRAIVHLPLIVPPGCGFRVGGETREWVEGRAFAFDDTIEHEAWNDSDRMRAVLIFDVWNPHLSPGEQEAIIRYYQAADSTGFGPARGTG